EQKVAEELMGSFYDTNPGVDRIVINAEAPHLIKFSQKFLRKGGQLSDVGLPSTSNFEVDPFSLNFKEQKICGQLICTPKQCQDMVKLHADNGCEVWIEKNYSVEQTNDMLEHYKSKQLQGRVCMVF
ncbi:hypothetical protein KC343_g21687, partial [Hortaea werneckii]